MFLILSSLCSFGSAWCYWLSGWWGYSFQQLELAPTIIKIQCTSEILIMTKMPIRFLFGLLLLAVGLGTVSCSGGDIARVRFTPTPAAPKVELSLASLSAMPGFVQDAPPTVQQAYRFAAANPEVLKKFPCYCGCGAMGHQDNLGCYVKGFQPDGSIEFDNHAAGCGICVDITQDVMRFMRQGQDLKTIRAYVDKQYSQYAASTNTPPIE
jgi:hypothetical protein